LLYWKLYAYHQPYSLLGNKKCAYNLENYLILMLLWKDTSGRKEQNPR